MAFPRRLMVLLLLLFLVVSATGVPTSRSLKTTRDEVSVLGNFQLQGVKKGMGHYGKFMKMEGLVERRMSIELADYPETGANNNHDPKPPGMV